MENDAEYQFVSIQASEAMTGDYVITLRRQPQDELLAFYGHDAEWRSADGTRANHRMEAVLNGMWRNHRPDDSTCRPSPATAPRRTRTSSIDIVQEASESSFPASDPPAWTFGARKLRSVREETLGSESMKSVELEPLASVGMDAAELADWYESLDGVAARHGSKGIVELLEALRQRAAWHGARFPLSLATPYRNTISVDAQPEYPGDHGIERRIRSLIRWNAMAMVTRANRENRGIGGHISSYASAATLFEVGFNHFFHAPTPSHTGDFVYFQGHSSPGVYARAYLEGRLTELDLERFRRETPRETGLSSYPHPWLMPGFWQFPTVSMGLGPLMAIYQARLLRYMAHRGILDTSMSHVWCFVGDGEIDEPESLGALTVAAREHLDNLTFVVICNLQRLDGPVRGNGKIIQELDGVFRGAGWNVIKVVWGGDWDPLLAADESGLLVQRMNEVVDGQYQKYTVESGAYIRDHFFGTSPELRALVDHLSDEQLQRLNRGGHDPNKVYAAYKSAVEYGGGPTVILAKTIKGYGLGEAGEGRNITHKQHELNEEELRAFRTRFNIPLTDEGVHDTPFYKPQETSEELEYLHARRAELGGFLPARKTRSPGLEVPGLDSFKRLLQGSDSREVATTMAFDRILSILLKNEHIGKRIVPIIPDEARTFGLDALFAQYGIYASSGQLYEPVDAGHLMHYREARDGQILEEGITEAGAMASFIAAGTSYAHLQTPMIPFLIYYSMFGFQRIGDLIWAAADARSKGFLLGATAGRTTLQGEGLQHEDGHSLLGASTVPSLESYDPAYAYELAVVVQDGLRRMYEDNDSIFYYLTLYNEPYRMPAMPEGASDGIRQGMYRLKSLTPSASACKARPQLFGSGSLLREALRAQEILGGEFDIGSDVWSVTSYCRLRRDAAAVARHNALHPGKPCRRSHIDESLDGLAGPFVAVTDYVSLVPDQIRPWVPGKYVTLGTDGFGRSDTRRALRQYFEVSAEHIVFATLHALSQASQFDREQLPGVLALLDIDPDAMDPATA